MNSFKNNESLESQAGFTLVELAVVMIIIGLLIGGVLKGQELINNAQVTATVSQAEGFDAATTTFRDIYAAFPGDMTNPDTRIPNCTNVCATAGDGDNVLGTAPDEAPGTEADAFFPQLGAADLVSGVNSQTAVTNVWGESFPEAEIGGAGFQPGYDDGTAGLGENANPRSGHYFALTGTADDAPTAAMTTSEAFRIDSKLDDGNATGGSIFVNEPACHDAGVYQTADQSDQCSLFIRFQQ